jgi:hypothetical protein
MASHGALAIKARHSAAVVLSQDIEVLSASYSDHLKYAAMLGS